MHASPLMIELLGLPHVARDGQRWQVPNLKAQALLFYLATTQKPAARDYLSALLWGDAPLNNARHSLRSALYKLRQGLESLALSGVLISDGDRISLDPRLIRTDLAQFQALISSDAEADLRAAAALVRGPFLHGFSLPDTTLFDEFLQQHDAWLTRNHQRLLEDLSLRAEQREDWEQAIADLQALIHLDPLDEQAHQRLLSVYMRSGSPSLAQRHYQFVERTFALELGAEPTEATRAILRATPEALRGPAPPVTAPPPFVRTTAPTLPFVGRSAPFERLNRYASEAASGRGWAVLIEGDAGSGKSRLVDELLAGLAPANSAPWQILQGRCSPFDTIRAFGVFYDALGHALPPAPQRPDDTNGSVTEQMLQCLKQFCQRGAVVLAIDDLQFADPASLQLFGYLALHLRSLPLLLIGTVHQIETTATLRELAAVGRRHGDLAVLSLTSLGKEPVRQLLAALGIDQAAANSLAPWLAERSAGNPFVIEALIGQLQSEELLTQQGERWQLKSAHWLNWRRATSLPNETHDLVSLRLNALGPLERRIVDLLATAEQPLDPEFLMLLLGEAPAAFAAACDELLARRLLHEQNGQLALAHLLLGEAALHQQRTFTRRALHRQLAHAWEVYQAQHPFAIAQIARHAVAAGEHERAHRYGLLLLNELPYAYGGDGTVQFLQQLADLVWAAATLGEQRRLAQALGQSQRALGNLDQAEMWHLRQLTAARNEGDAAAQALAQFELGDLAFVRNDYSAAIAAAQQGLALANKAGSPDQASLIGRGHRLLGGALAIEGSDLVMAEAQLHHAIGAHRAANDSTNLSVALFELGNVLAQQGEIVCALERYHEAYTAACEGQAPFLQALANNNLAYHYLLLGKLEASRAALDLGRAIAEQHGLASALLHIFSTESEYHRYCGNWAEAEAVSHHGLGLAEYLGNPERQAGYRASLALITAQRGQIAEAQRQLHEALALIAPHAFWHLRTRLLLWLAELALDHEPKAAALYLDTALTLARTQQRGLLLFQAERLAALRLAQSDLSAAQTRLVELLDQAAARNLSLEVARTRATLARATLKRAPNSPAGRQLLATALRELHSFGALAEARALEQ